MVKRYNVEYAKEKENVGKPCNRNSNSLYLCTIFFTLEITQNSFKSVLSISDVDSANRKDGRLKNQKIKLLTLNCRKAMHN